jgi:PST family polysaccharide transporter
MFSYVAVGLPLAYLGYGYQALVWATLLEAIVYALVTFFRQPHKISFGINKAVLKELLSHGSLFTTANILNYFASQADYFVVGKLMGPASLGLYSRAYRLMNMSNTILGSVMSKVLFPSFSKMRDDKVALLRSLKRAYEIVFIIFIPASGLSCILAPEIIHILFGSKWSAVIPIFQVLSLAMFLRIGYKVGGSVVRGQKLFKKQAIAQGIYFINVIVGAYIGSFWGLTGVAVGVYVALLIIFIHLSNLAIIQSEWNWGDLVKNIARHMAIHIPILVINYFTAVYLRSKHVNEFLIIGGVMLEWLACIVGVYKVKSKILLGDSEDWIKSNVFAKLGYKVQPS